MKTLYGANNRPLSKPKTELHRVGGIDVNVYEDTRVSFSAPALGTPKADGTEVELEDQVESLRELTKRQDHLIQAMLRELVEVRTDLDAALEEIRKLTAETISA